MALHVIIPAAGSSLRMGGGVSKLLRTISGCSIISRTLSVVSRLNFDSLTVMVAAGQEETYRSILRDEVRLQSFEVLVGGATRQESVWLGLSKLDSLYSLGSKDYVLIHDAARCLVTIELLEKCVSAAKDFVAVTAALPVVDTLKRVNSSGHLECNLPREGTWRIQTPQVFRADLIVAAHRRARQQSLEATDDASLVQELHSVQVVEGERSNIKITTSQDLAFAESMLSHKKPQVIAPKVASNH